MEKIANQSLSAVRLKKYMKYHLATRWKNIAVLYGSLMLAYMLLMLLPLCLTANTIYRYQFPHNNDLFWETELVVAALMAIAFAVLCGNMMFSSMHSRENRMRVLLIPASYLEKYITYFIFYMVAGIVVYFISAFISDVLHVIVVTNFYDVPGTAHIMPWYSPTKILYLIDNNSNRFILFFICAILALHGTFTLGGIVWYKHTLIKTAALLYIYNWVCTIVVAITLYLLFKDFHHLNMSESPYELSRHTFWALSTIFMLVTAVGFQLLAVWRFRESDLNFRW